LAVIVQKPVDEDAVYVTATLPLPSVVPELAVSEPQAVAGLPLMVSVTASPDTFVIGATPVLTLTVTLVVLATVEVLAGIALLPNVIVTVFGTVVWVIATEPL
jgi:hypothetical protein